MGFHKNTISVTAEVVKRVKRHDMTGLLLRINDGHTKAVYITAICSPGNIAPEIYDDVKTGDEIEIEGSLCYFKSEHNIRVTRLYKLNVMA